MLKHRGPHHKVGPNPINRILPRIRSPGFGSGAALVTRA